MSERIKGNADIRAEKSAFTAAYLRAREHFSEIPGVDGVGVGHREAGGKFTSHVVITVFVNRKIPDEDLPPEQRIPATFEGFPVDVRVTPHSTLQHCENVKHYEEGIRGGIQIEVDGAGGLVGTLGCIVRKRNERGRENVHLLTCRHVLHAGSARAGSTVYQPSVSGAHEALGPVAALAFQSNESYTFRLPDGTPMGDSYFIDCGTARINIDCKCGDSTCTKDKIGYTTTIDNLFVQNRNTISDVRNAILDLDLVLPSDADAAATAVAPRVFKVGRTTGRTVGFVRSVSLRATLPDGSKQHNLIEIEFDPSSEDNGLNCKGHPLFSEGGDSGSLVVDEAGAAIGLLIGSLNENNSSIASHIAPVLHNLEICIPTAGGVSRGSCGATDGSGVENGVVASMEQPVDGDLHLLVSAQARPIHITDAERSRMLLLRDALRESTYGIELHDTFADIRREIGYLVRNVRPVKVAWHRHCGPAYFAHVLNHLRGQAPSIPHEIDGITRTALLTRMGEVLHAHGSSALRRAIERHGPILLPIFTSADAADDCPAALRALDTRAPEEVSM